MTRASDDRSSIPKPAYPTFRRSFLRALRLRWFNACVRMLRSAGALSEARLIAGVMIENCSRPSSRCGHKVVLSADAFKEGHGMHQKRERGLRASASVLWIQQRLRTLLSKYETRRNLSYRPEQHYMRGPGPKCRHSASAPNSRARDYLRRE